MENFSLYRNRRNVEVDIRDSGVFCLAGANGLGKSTFLAAINFGLTGIVAQPGRAFRDFEQFYNDNLSFSGRYFDGRVDELDHDLAVIILHFSVGRFSYQLARGLFEPRSLRALTVSQRGRKSPIYSDALGDEEDDERALGIHAEYCKLIVEHCGLGSFEQFVFMQHFMLSFDERRHLIFWDPAVSDPALYLAFGLDAHDTVLAADLKSRMTKAESLARNAQWQATQARNRLRDLGVEGQSMSDLGDLVATHQALTAAVDAAEVEAREATESVNDAYLRQAELSARQARLRQNYDEVFAQRLISKHDPAHHPVIQRTLNSGECEVCGSSDSADIASVAEALAKRRCPLCGNKLDAAGKNDQADRIQAIDEDLKSLAEELSAANQRIKRLQLDMQKALAQREAEAAKLAAFESSHVTRLPGLKSASGSLEKQANELLLEQRNAERRRDEHRAARDQYRVQLRPLQDKLATAYQQAELEFVPLFQDLAFRFIGLDLDVYLESKEGVGFSLGLAVQGLRRRAPSQLSESQRFFLDIALRMALAEHMAPSDSPCTLLIDTPEGSLDIAYEARAGDMFADFVAPGNQIVMTANINASQLLRRLGERCGDEAMELVRMTDWAPLSEVQASEEQLFDEAFERIEISMREHARADGGRP